VAPGEGTRTDAQGAFVIAAAPAGQIVVSCGGLWRNYSDGARLVTLAPAQRADLDVPVVAWSEEPGTTLGGIGAELEDRVLVPQLVRVQPAGPAGTGGFHDGDLVVTVDGASVTELSPHGVWALIVNRSPGTKVKLGVTRAGKSVTGEITLGDAPQ
jgi:S1-C subfamily serine protease